MGGPFKGVFCAAATPLDADLNRDEARLARHCRRLLDRGCHGVALLGSTGEANSFSVSERKAMLEAVVASGVEAEKLLPGTGVCAIPETVDLTRHALALGVTTVIVLPPFYYKAVSEEGLYEAYARVIDGVADPRLRVVLYHIPPISQIAITPSLIERLIARYPETIVGVKDSGGELEHMTALARTFPSLSIFAGADPLMRPLLESGGAGCITATSNLLSAELRTIFDHFADPAREDDVAAAQARVVAIRNLSNSHPQIPTIKAMVGHVNGEAGWERVRPPFRPLSEAQRAEVAAAMG
ncbi:dihydrodipicolinate synthase family protein [Consotaella aegiceratis]|uniref:dihydrodipicolinate synthase family protein n=1 Tax=Consotaella aegiceratis TaxID=3097961 RepID=UPI002F409868